MEPMSDVVVWRFRLDLELVKRALKEPLRCP